MSRRVSCITHHPASQNISAYIPNSDSDQRDELSHLLNHDDAWCLTPKSA